MNEIAKWFQDRAYGWWAAEEVAFALKMDEGEVNKAITALIKSGTIKRAYKAEVGGELVDLYTAGSVIPQ